MAPRQKKVLDTTLLCSECQTSAKLVFISNTHNIDCTNEIHHNSPVDTPPYLNWQNPNPPAQPKLVLVSLLVLTAVLLTTGAFSYWIGTIRPKELSNQDILPNNSQTNSSKNLLKKFTSQEEFRLFLSNFTETYGDSAPGLERSLDSQTLNTPNGIEPSAQPSTFSTVSQTNIQVAGIDEPDILKNNGQQLFYSSSNQYDYAIPLLRSQPSGIFPDDIYQPPSPKSYVFQAYPAQDSSLASKIPTSGPMLLFDSTLIFFANQKLQAFNVKNPANPETTWNLDYAENSQFVTARSINDQILLVMQTYPQNISGCEIPILSNSKVLCTDIWYPPQLTSGDSLVTFWLINPQTGQIKSQYAQMSRSSDLLVYVSPKHIYLANALPPRASQLKIDAILQAPASMFPNVLKNRLKQINNYEISDQAKQVELELTLNNFYQSLSSESRLKLENDFNNYFSTFQKTHGRDYQQSTLVQINTDKLQVQNSRDITGRLLNQFPLDEYKEVLRLAVTINPTQDWQSLGATNEVYTLSTSNLETLGQVTNLGEDERIYAVRFINTQAYLVTFRQTDPFYVLDLSNPRSPTKIGELKIPGYSTYLHSLSPNRILGVGQENGQVKLSLFNVQNQTLPKEIAKYQLNEYWSEANENHHAFLQDPDTATIFIPGSQAGYIFQYAQDKSSQPDRLELLTTIPGSATRAAYIKDAFYVFTNDNLKIFDRTSWKVIKTLTFN